MGRLAAAEDVTPKQADFFAPEVVQNIQLEVTPANLDRLASSLPERVYVPARFRWRGQVIDRVGLRYKGNSSSRPDQRHKRGFLVKFSEFVKGQRFLGLRRVSLDNGVQFGSLFSERIITDILAEVGVPASRTNYARVTLNGKFIGVYVNVERIDKAFLSNRLDDADGAL
ncbi:MAG: CotH kinase family protein, partial [Planctomycetota bacterium]|nr:CotH kinase family protein [Planctomycetota bacterium]